jgi:hypothetical protein
LIFSGPSLVLPVLVFMGSLCCILAIMLRPFLLS